MAEIHFLNVGNGDCSYIKHNNGRISVIDVNNAYLPTRQTKVNEHEQRLRQFLENKRRGDYNQKANPVNPIDYLKQHGVADVFRFILTHPDMDHMDGIEDFFEVFTPTNFWDTENTKKLADFSSGRFNESDWDFYKDLRRGNGLAKRLTLYDGARGAYFNKDADGTSSGNGLYILAPTPSLIEKANNTENWNDSSYVILYRCENRKILFCGDADNNTWLHLLEHHKEDLQGIDLLIAPHHGRKSSCSYEFLEVMKPKLTFFGNTDKASHLATDMFRKLNLRVITNNQGGCLIASIAENKIHIYVTHEAFAIDQFGGSHYNSVLQGYYALTI